MLDDATKRLTRCYGDAMSQAVGVATAADIAAAYAGCRARISALAAGLDEQQAGARVPACPAWAVKDVVAHLTGICADVLAGNIDGVATDPWTAAQVAARRDTPLARTVAEWSELGPQVEALVPAFPLDAARQMLADIVTHEHDVRGALHEPGARDSDAVAIGIHFVAHNFLAAGAHADLPPLRIRADGRRPRVGDGGSRARDVDGRGPVRGAARAHRTPQ
jgi:hypothetical protein